MQGGNAQVSEYVKERVLALRKTYPGQYQNAACLRTNSMKYMPNYIEKGQLEKLFFLFPDPHFKVCSSTFIFRFLRCISASNIVNGRLLA